MPTIDRFGGNRVFFYSNEHLPAHVHIENGNGQAAFLLNCPDGPATLRDEPFGISESDANKLCKTVSESVAAYCDKWRQYFGQ